MPDFGNPFVLTGSSEILPVQRGIDIQQPDTFVAETPETVANPQRKFKEQHDHTPEECCVGRCLINDALPGWDTPCNAESSEEINLKGFQGVPDDYVLYFCPQHGPIFRKAYSPGESLN